jgi:class 3 adenylate cyclase
MPRTTMSATSTSSRRRFVDAGAAFGLKVRAGLHTGECERVEGELTGIAVNLGAGIAAAAGAREAVVSSTVRDLVAGQD